MSEVMAHEWMNGEIATEEEARAEMKERFNKIEQVKAAERANNSVDHHHTQAMRSGKDKFEVTNRELDIFDDNLAYSKKTQFFSTKHPDLIQKRITDHLTRINIVPEISSKKYKMKFEIQTTGQDGVNQVTKISVRTLKVKSDKKPEEVKETDEQKEDLYKGEFCTEFSMIKGSLEEFHKTFGIYRDKVIIDDKEPSEETKTEEQITV